MRLQEDIHQRFLAQKPALALRQASLAALAAVLLFLAIPFATVHGAAVAWVGNTSNILDNTSNWSANPVGQDAQFAAPGSSGSTLLLTNPLTLKSITFTSAANSTSYILNGSSTLTISSNNGITNSSTSTQTINTAITLGSAQNWNAQSGNLVIGGNVNNGGYLLTFNGNSVTTISGAISGTGGLTQNGNGTVTLAGSNSYTGVTNISKGTLQFATENSLYGGVTSNWTAANIIVGNNATLVLNVGGTNEFTSSDVATLLGNLTTISNNGLNGGSSIGFDTTNAAGGVFTLAYNLGNSTGGGGGSIGVVKLGSNTLVLTGNNTYSGVTTISGGILQVGAGGTTGTLGTGAVTNNASLVFDRSDSFTQSIAISGTGSLTQGGTGTLTLSGNNTYTGNTIISSGTLRLGGSTVIPNGGGYGNVVFNPSSGTATLDLNGMSETINGLSSSGAGLAVVDNSTGNGVLTLGGNNASSTFSGNIINTGGTLSLVKTGTGTVTLSGSNTYSGTTKINQGILQFGTVNSLYGGVVSNWTPANIIVSQGDTLALNVGGPNEFTNSNITTLLANLTTVNNNGLERNSFIGFDTTNAAGGTFTISGTIADSTGGGGGSIGVAKLGSNTLVLSGNNSYTGGTNILAGVLNIQSNNALGGTAGTTTVSSGAQLQVQGGISTSELITINGNGLANDGAILNVSGSNTLSGNITLGSSATIGANAGSSLTLSGQISGNNNYSLTMVGSGTVTLSGAQGNNYNGATVVNAGTLILSKNSGQNAIPGSLTIGDGVDAAVVQLNASNQTGNNSTVAVNAPGQFNLNNFSDTIGALVMTGGSVTTGSGTLTLNSNSLTTNAASTTATISGNLGLQGNATFTTASGSAGTDLLISASITGNRSITKAGSGTMVLSGSNTINGLAVTSGAVNLQNSAALGTATPTVSNGAALQLQGGISIANTLTLNGGGVANDGALRNISGSNTYAGAITLASSSTIGSDAGTLTLSGGITNGGYLLTVTGSGNEAVNSVISGAGGLTKNGTGSVALSGSNTYTGPTTVNAGNLSTGTFTISPSGKVSIASGATYTSTGTINLTPSTTGAQTFFSGAGTLVLRNASPTTAAPDIYYDPAGGTGAGWGVTIATTVDVGTGSRIINGRSNRNDFERYAGDLIFGGSLLGSANLTFTGTPNGAWQMAYVLQADNSSFTGGVVLSAGANLILNSANALTSANSVTFNPASGAVSGLYLYGRSITIGALSGTAAGTMNIRNGSLTTDTNAWITKSNAILTVQQDTNTTFNGTISDGPNDDGAGSTGTYYTLGLTKTGSGSLALGGTNTYTGATIINAGALVVNNPQSLGATSSGLTINAGTLEAAATFSSSRSITLGSSASTIMVDFSQTYTLTSPLAGSGTLTKTGNGTLMLNSPATYAGSTNVTAGVLHNGVANALPTGTTLTVSNAGSYDLGGNSQTVAGLADGGTSTGVVTNSGVAATFTVNNTGANSFSGTISGSTLALTKSGIGTLTLSGSNTYAGATNVNAGTLLVTGSISGSAVTVASGAQLSGTGTTGSVMAQGGSTVAPGNGGTGILNTGNFNLNTSATLSIRLGGTTAGTQYDQVNVTGGVTLAGTLQGSLINGYAPAHGDKLFIIINDGVDAVTGTFTGLAQGSTFNIGAFSFQISYTGDSVSGSFTGGNDVLLMAVPEPKIDILLGLGALLLLRRVGRRLGC